MSGKKRRSSIETIERFVKDVHQSPAEHSRERRLSLTMMNCIWARNTDVETNEPVAGEITGKIFGCKISFYTSFFCNFHQSYNFPTSMSLN